MSQKHTFCFLCSAAQIISSSLYAGESHDWNPVSGKVIPAIEESVRMCIYLCVCLGVC